MSAKDDFSKLRDNIQEKITKLLNEFQAGDISREQFNIIYDRYNNQLDLALRVSMGDIQELPGGGISTEAIKDATMGKATGIAIYHHNSSTFIEVLGDYVLSPDTVTPVLNDYSEKIDEDAFIEPRVEPLDSGHHVVYVTEDFTTAIVVFRNEPSQRQIKGLERIMHDFEHANRNLLEKNEVDSSKLAQPFISVVKLHKHN